MKKNKSIMVVAGEASGDAHMAQCVQQFQKQNTNVTWFGLGGDKLAQAGVQLNHHYKDINVMGFVEVIRHYPKIRKIFKDCVRLLKEQQPDILVLVDYPGFNLRLAKEASALGVKVFYFIAPKIWASRAKRLKVIQENIDQMAVIFPFEVELYQKAGVAVSYVGNPLARVTKLVQTKQEAQAEIGLSSKLVVGLFPGSRTSELSHILPTLVESAEALLKSYPEMHFVLPLANHLGDVSDLVKSIADRLTIVAAEKIHIVTRASDVVVVASGTATLEVALLETLQVVVYKMSGLSYFLAKRLITIGHVSLVNIVAKKLVVQELLQENFNPNNVCKEVISLLEDRGRKNKMQADYQQIKAGLGELDTAEKVTQLLEDMVKNS